MQTSSFLSQPGECTEYRGADHRCIPRASGVRRYAAGGFSLIEVVIALGVVSFAFVALFGMLPIGLNAFNNSIDSTVESQIAESVMSQLRQARFSELYSLYNDTQAGASPSFFKPFTQRFQPPQPGFYYDDQGNAAAIITSGTPETVTNPVTTALTPQNSNYIYSAGVQVYYDKWNAAGNSTPPFGVQPSDSGVTSASVDASQPIATVVITISKVSSPNTARIFIGYIGNNGF